MITTMPAPEVQTSHVNNLLFFALIGLVVPVLLLVASNMWPEWFATCVSNCRLWKRKDRDTPVATGEAGLGLSESESAVFRQLYLQCIAAFEEEFGAQVFRSPGAPAPESFSLLALLMELSRYEEVAEKLLGDNDAAAALQRAKRDAGAKQSTPRPAQPRGKIRIDKRKESV